MNHHPHCTCCLTTFGSGNGPVCTACNHSKADHEGPAAPAPTNP